MSDPLLDDPLLWLAAQHLTPNPSDRGLWPTVTAAELRARVRRRQAARNAQGRRP